MPERSPARKLAGVLQSDTEQEERNVALVLAEYGESVVGPEGCRFRARALALPTRAGQWQGWIEFNPTNGEPTFRSPNETLQPSRTGVTDWAASRTPNYLAAALDRALGRLGYPARKAG